MVTQLVVSSEQRSEFAQKLISTRESTLRRTSRELHDEFGQILTAAGAMLTRTGNQAPMKSELRAELREACAMMQSALDWFLLAVVNGQIDDTVRNVNGAGCALPAF